MYAVRRRMSLFHRMLVIGGITAVVSLILMMFFIPDISAQTSEHPQHSGEVENGDSLNVQTLSVSTDVTVSVTVLKNLHLLISNGSPQYGTNSPYGATLHIKSISKSILVYTVTANY